MEESEKAAIQDSLASVTGQMTGLLAWLQALTVTHPRPDVVLEAFDAYVAPLEAMAVASPVPDSAVEAVLAQVQKVRSQIPQAPSGPT